MNRVFPNFPKEAKCPLCDTNENKECLLVPIDGTEEKESNIMQAQPVHLECLQDQVRYDKELDLIYCLKRTNMNKTQNQNPRPLFEIAEEIENDWQGQGKVHARPYIKAMTWLQTMDDHYFDDSAEKIVLCFLTNAQTWHGETARRIKAELKAMLPKRK